MISLSSKKLLIKLISKYKKKEYSENSYPLLDNAFNTEDLLKGIEVILSQRITMSDITKEFEYEFAKYIGSKYALMVNSGSSANLLVAFSLINPKKNNYLRRNDYFLIPAICWSTSLWPFVQAGLKPIFIDVNINNYCLDEKKIDNKILNKIRLIVTIHVLGNCSNIDLISRLSKNNNIFLVEDTCESLGSKYQSKYLGTFGDFGTYSFYYSHQITAGEGGMIVCNKKEDYELLHTLRAHGWDRGLGKKFNNTFNFINSGFNVRPLDITAAIGLNQFKRLNKMISVRTKNRELIINAVKKHKKYNNQFEFFYPIKDLRPSWFGMPLLVNKNFKNSKKKFLEYLNFNRIETRPIISGNFLNQPSAKLYNLRPKNIIESFPKSQEIEDRGFFIGLPTHLMSKNKINYLVEKLVGFDDF
ncbi:MAG: DegT/DnrJ/EryC1/StrS family aminotransferase [Flavobacteriia bacterium]|nr:DegT/DnrJ/EryC1/StrS family aminotransferase [Flavobacteriia bacterium]